jgi:hypothetical protein
MDLWARSQASDSSDVDLPGKLPVHACQNQSEVTLDDGVALKHEWS